MPLSIAASFLDGTTGFLRALCAKDPTKFYFLDPRTPLFQYNWPRTNVRPPHIKAAEILGDPFLAGLEGPIVPTQFDLQTVLGSTKRCIDYQRQLREHQLSGQAKIKKYMKLAELESLPDLPFSECFVPPYFKFQTINDVWSQVSQSCIEAARGFVAHESILPIIHFDNAANSGDWSELIQRLLAWGIERVCLYPNNFREHDRHEDELTALAETVKLFSSSGLNVMQLHGGYFAVTMQIVGLTGFGNGVGYSEWRDSGYHRGGSAEKRIYVPELHRFLESTKAQAILNSAPELAGDSELLEEWLSTGTPLDALSNEQTIRHFMECRKDEMLKVSLSTPQDLANDLISTANLLENLGPLESDYGTSLTRWASVMSKWHNG